MVRIIITTSLVLLFGLFSVKTSLGQNDVVNLPRVIQPPPDAGALGKYGSVPVSMYTGSPDISVPLYTINTPRLSLPVTLNYNGTGIKVDDLATWVGLEWSLNAGGVITRTIRGIDDFGGNGYYSTSVPLANTVTAQNSWGFFDNYMRHAQDADPDFFFFNFGSYSGKFFFDENKTPVIVNYQQPVKIQYSSSTETFTIKDEKGNTYYFNTQEAGTTSGDYNGYATAPPYVSSWYLSKVLSFDRSDSITLSYTNDALLEQDSRSYTESIGPYFSNGIYNVQGHFTSTGEPFTKSAPARLSEIDYKNGKIVFYGSATRLDQAGDKLDSLVAYRYDYAHANYIPIKKAIFSYDYYITTTSMGTQPTICHNADRLRLDSVAISGNGGTFGGTYKFAYDPNMLPWTGSNAKDLFGYFNGSITNASLIPTQTVTFATTQYTVGAADRSTQPTYLQNGILRTITYPTGGYTNFTYEPNTFASGGGMTTHTALGANAFGVTAQADTSPIFAPTTLLGSPQVSAYISSYNYPGVRTPPFAKIIDVATGQTVYSAGLPNPNTGTQTSSSISLIFGHSYESITGAYDDGRITAQIYVSWQTPNTNLQIATGGGLRILQTIDYDYTGRFLTSDLYKYGTNESGYGILTAPVQLFNTMSYNPTFIYPVTLGNTGSPSSPYSQVREIFSASTVYDCFSLSGAPVSYPQVTKYAVDSFGIDIGKSVFYYNQFQDSVENVPYAYFGGFYLSNSGWTGGQLLLDEEYAHKNGSFWPVKRSYTSYTTPPLSRGRGLQIGFQDIYQGTPATDSADVSQYWSGLYYWFDYPIYAGSVLPAAQTIYDYDQTDTAKYVMTSRQLFYDNLDHLQPTTVQTTQSDGSILITINRYPAEVDSISNLTTGEIAAIDSLQSRHNTTALIQTQTTRNSTPVNLQRNDYKIWNANLILPDSIEQQISNFPIQTRILINRYDSYGNPVQQQKTKDLFETYIWDYHSQYPIAKCVNADSISIAYTSFEADGSGSWQITSSTRDTGSITGNSCYNLSNGNISRSGLTGGSSYVVSFWKRGGTAALTGTTSVVQGKTINGWTYFEYTVTGVSTETLSGSGEIDELRLYPTNAEMTTFTYNPLVGITSQCDIANRITYYSYDGLGRLNLSKDQDGNIIKTYQYHFIGH